MRAVVVAGPDDVRVESVPDARLLDDGDAIVEVRKTAICGSDLPAFHGLVPGWQEGTILGHEFVGVVAEIGPGVRGIRLGQRVVCTSTISDGTCPQCRAGRATQCQGKLLFGHSGLFPRLDGGQAELVRVPRADYCLLPLPDEVSDEAGVFLGDILPTAYGAVLRSEIGVGDTAVVVGCGPVGLMAVLCARGVAGRLLAVDGIPARRELAARLGAEAVEPEAAADAVAAATGGLGADVVIEAAGSPPALDAALRLARGRGTVSVVGLHFEPDFPLDNGYMFEHELTLRFTIGEPAAYRERLLGMVAAGRLDPTEVITHRLPLASAPEAYRLFASREAAKVMLEP